MEAVLNKPVVTFSVDLKHALSWVAHALDYVAVADVFQARPYRDSLLPDKIA